MSDGAYSCSDYPGEPQEGVDTDEDTHNQQIKMIPRPFLKGKREGETEGGREGQEGREDAEEERRKRGRRGGERGGERGGKGVKGRRSMNFAPLSHKPKAPP